MASVEQVCGTWAGLLRHQLRREVACDQCASAVGPPGPSAAEGLPGAAAAEGKRKPFFLVGDPVPGQVPRDVVEMDPRRSDALIIEI